MAESVTRHALTLGIDMNKLVRLMGHGSKKMVYEVYGDYIEGLEDDAWKILEYFGRDFLETKAKRPSHLPGYPQSGNMVIPVSFLRIDQETKNPALLLKTF